MMADGPEWFAPKRYGLGSGLPIAWQGWVVFLSYLTLIGLASLLVHRSVIAYLSVVTTLTVALTVICARTTRGGWRWRWGGED